MRVTRQQALYGETWACLKLSTPWVWNSYEESKRSKTVKTYDCSTVVNTVLHLLENFQKSLGNLQDLSNTMDAEKLLFEQEF